MIDKMCFAADTAKYAKYSIDDLVIWAGDYDDAPTEEEKPTDPDDSSSNSSGSSSSDNSASSDTSSSSGSSDSGSGQNPDASDKPRPDRDRVHLRSSSLRAAVRRRPVMPGNLRCGVW